MRKAELVGPVQLHTVTHIHDAVDELGGFIVVLPFLAGSGSVERRIESGSDALGSGGSDGRTSGGSDGRTSGGSDGRTSGASSGSSDGGALSVVPAVDSMSMEVRVSALQFLVILLKTSKSALKVTLHPAIPPATSEPLGATYDL